MLGSVFTPLDMVIFFGFLVFAMAVGLIAGRKEDTSEDFFLAGRKIPWWGVAGSIFGSNVSANHMVGMMGIGFSIGFAQSHFELGAIAGLMMLCYGFLPVYRKLNLYTLSEYLERRYDARSRICYAVIMVVIMAFVQMVPGLYIGARSICVLVGEDAVTEVPAVEQRDPAADAADETATPAAPQSEIEVNKTYYAVFVIALAVISASYTIFGGLKAVVWTDVIQSVLLLAAGIVVAILTFRAVGGWNEMMALDRAADGADKMHLYLPMNHDQLPWTGVFTGLMFMHCFYWGTNQFIVQRALAARSDYEARVGIIAAGYLKLLIPFFAIASGVAAVYVFRQERPGVSIAPDTAFTEMVKLVIPIGYGLIGLIAAGLIGAILSSIDSMMNSAATIITVDIYQRYIKPAASEREMILVGRLSIVALVIVAALLAILVLDPNSKQNFFLQIADYQNYLTPGILVAFILGMFWKRGTATAGFVAIVAGVVFSALLVWAYDSQIGTHPGVYAVASGEKDIEQLKPTELPEAMRDVNMQQRRELIEQERERLTAELPLLGSRMQVMKYFGPRLNFFHRVVGVMGLCALVYVLVSLCGRPTEQASKLTWTDLGGHDPAMLRNLMAAIGISIGVYALLGWLMYDTRLDPTFAAILGSLWTMAMFGGAILVTRNDRATAKNPLRDDRLWAGILCSLAVFMLFYFY